MHFILALIIFALDRISKVLITVYLAPYTSQPILGSLMSFTHVHNTGAAFSILQGKRVFFIITTLILMGIILYVYYKLLPITSVLTITTGLILGGALGNFYDRIVYGYVIDFIDFHFFPVFNIADSAVVIGTLLLAWQLWRSSEVGV